MATMDPGQSSRAPGGRCPGSKRVMAFVVGEASGNHLGADGTGADGRRVHPRPYQPRPAMDAPAIAGHFLREWSASAPASRTPNGRAHPLIRTFEAMIADNSEHGDEQAWRLRMDSIDMIIASVDALTALIRGIMPAIPAVPLQAVAPEQMNHDEGMDEVVPEEDDDGADMPDNGGPFHGVRRELIGEAMLAGRKFLTVFMGPFLHRLVCPPNFSQQFAGNIVPVVRIIGEAGVEIEVPAHIEDGLITFTGPWYDLVEAERIVCGDIGLFVHYAPHHLALFIFHPDGEEKPFANRALYWDPDMAVAHQGVIQNINPAAHNNLPVPHQGQLHNVNLIQQNNVEDNPMVNMWIDHSRNVDLTDAVLAQMLDLWLTRLVTYPLYAMKLNHSNVARYHFYLSAHMSQWFPDQGEVTVQFYHREGPWNITGSMTKQRNMMRVHQGWREMVQAYGYQINDTIVLCMTDEHDGVAIRIFPVA
ncbi:unnamed protein product [Urochloa humidicola]